MFLCCFCVFVFRASDFRCLIRHRKSDSLIQVWSTNTMVRVKRGKTKLKRRKKLLKEVKGYKWGRKNRKKLAKEALMKALSYAYCDRKRKKQDFRRLWQQQINAGVREHGLTYSKFISLLKKNNIQLDRKILAQLAREQPKTFKKIIENCRCANAN